MRRLLFRLSGVLPCRIIADGDEPYLERYFLFRAFGLQAYLHRFVASDPDRGLHDHPWPWALAIVLAGRYREMRRSGAREVRWFNLLTEDTFHRVVIPAGAPDVWTLFVHRSGRTKLWGFWNEAKTLDLDGKQFPARSIALWRPYRYPGDTRVGAWWREAPRGRFEPRRMPFHREAA